MRYKLPILLTPPAILVAVLAARMLAVTTPEPRLMAESPGRSAEPQNGVARHGSPQGGSSTTPDAGTLLETAIRTMEGHRSVFARVRQQGDLFGHQLLGSGRYLEVRQAAVPLLRIELKIQVAEHVTSLVQVCDGQKLWTYRKLLDAETLSFVDAVRATEALRQASADARGPGGLPGLGGLPRLLRGLRSAFLFTSPQEGRLGDMAVWKLEGGWRPEYLVKLLPKQKSRIEQGEAAELSRLPPHVPDRVVVLLGREDLFPYRIDYGRSAVGKKELSDAEGKPALLTVEFFDVALDVAISPHEFIYKPGTTAKSDRTQEFLQSLRK